MIVVFTDFGVEGPYIGQMKAVLARHAPDSPVIDLFYDVPAYDIRAAAYLLAAYGTGFEPDTVFLCVVDPGVGGSRKPVVVEVDGCLYVGPDNGLFEIIAQHGSIVRWREIIWRPEMLSATFHGRDLFAPVAARLARGETLQNELRELPRHNETIRPEDHASIIYIDHFGNAVTGIRAVSVSKQSRFRISGHTVSCARTFSDVNEGTPFWYENSNGLVEIAVNQGRADTLMQIEVGDTVECLQSD